VASFVDPPPLAVLEASWERQRARLRNVAVTAAAIAGPTGGIDPDRPFASIRAVELRPEAGADRDRLTVRLELVRQEVSRDRFLGLPSTARRLVPVVELGTIELVRIERPHPIPALPPVGRWAIAGLDILGESIGGG
jgi:hypothetical protein